MRQKRVQNDLQQIVFSDQQPRLQNKHMQLSVNQSNKNHLQ